MANKQIDKLMSALLIIASSLVLISALFQLEHWQYGKQIFMAGLISDFVIGGVEISRLKRVVKSLETKLQVKE